MAALQQAEQGHLDLDAPVADYCPEFAGVQVLTGFDGDTPRYWFWSEDLVRWEKVTGVPNVVAGSRASFTAPMLADPGEKFSYGINIDWLGKVVEAVTRRRPGRGDQAGHHRPARHGPSCTTTSSGHSTRRCDEVTGPRSGRPPARGRRG